MSSSSEVMPKTSMRVRPVATLVPLQERQDRGNIQMPNENLINIQCKIGTINFNFIKTIIIYQELNDFRNCRTYCEIFNQKKLFIFVKSVTIVILVFQSVINFFRITQKSLQSQPQVLHINNNRRNLLVMPKQQICYKPMAFFFICPFFVGGGVYVVPWQISILTQSSHSYHPIFA